VRLRGLTMTWAWLFAWNASWFVWALAYMHLQTNLESGSLQAGLEDRQLERREVGLSRQRSVRARRVRHRL
jgi:hypothetical protein